MELQRFLRPLLGQRPSVSQATYSASDLPAEGDLLLAGQPLVGQSSVDVCEAGVQVDEECLALGEAADTPERIVISERSKPKERDLSLWVMRNDGRFRESEQTRYLTTMRRLFPGALDAIRYSAAIPEET